MSQYSVSQRVQDLDGYKCTVKYVGPVAASKNLTEIWCGVEWDDKKRGKHDGSCVDSKGVFHRYFECEMGAGSFVKPAKLAPALSFFDALKMRYVEMEAEQIATADNILPDCFVQTAKGNQRSIEFVGELKIRKWQQIDVVSKTVMRSLGITHIGDGTGVKMSHIDNIDLQDNLLWQWEEVLSLCRQMEGLRSLQLHGNKMQPFTHEICKNWSTGCFQNIRVLALNACGITSWTQVCLLSRYITNVEELYLTNNDLSDIAKYSRSSNSAIGAPPVTVFSNLTVHETDNNTAGANSNTSDDEPLVTTLEVLQQLTVLDIAHCKISSWTDIEYIMQTTVSTSNTATTSSSSSDGSCVHQQRVLSLPALTDLLLDGNPIPCVEPAREQANSQSLSLFPPIQRLSASSTNLSSWTDIDALATYPSLKFLRLTHVPLFAGKGVSELRPLVIGRIAQLAVFNGSAISARERTDSEKSYLRRIQREVIMLTDERKAKLQAAQTESEAATEEQIQTQILTETELEEAVSADVAAAIIIKHPRFAALNELYGRDLLPMADGTQRNNTTLSEDLVKITFNNLILSSEDCEDIVKKLPSSVQVGKLKQMVKALFRLDTPIHLISLSLRAYKDRENPPLLLDDDSCTLAYFGVTSDGGNIYINEMKDEHKDKK